MPIAPGTPIPTGQVHPLATLMGGGMKNFAHGASLASARMNQNAAGLTAFFSDSVRQQIHSRTKELEERKFKVGTELKKEEMEWRRSASEADLALREKTATAQVSISRAREARLTEEHNAKMQRQKDMANAMKDFMGLGVGQPSATASPEGQTSPSATGTSIDNPAYFDHPGTYQPRNMSSFPSPTGGHTPTGGLAPAEVPDGGVDELEQAIGRGIPQRKMVEGGHQVGALELDKGYEDMRKMQLAAIQMHIMSGNYSAAMGIRMKMASDDLERLELQHGTPKHQAEVIATNNAISTFDPIEFVFKDSELPREVYPEAVQELASRNTSFKLTQLPEGSLNAMLQRNEKFSVSTLSGALNFQSAKIANYREQKANIGLALGHSVMAGKQIAARLDPVILREVAKRTMFEKAIVREMKNLNMDRQSMASMETQLTSIGVVQSGIKLDIAEVGRPMEKAKSKDDHPDYDPKGKDVYFFPSGQLEKVEGSINWYYSQIAKEKKEKSTGWAERTTSHRSTIKKLNETKVGLRLKQEGFLGRLGEAKRQESLLIDAMSRREELLKRTDGSTLTVPVKPEPIPQPEEATLGETAAEMRQRVINNAVNKVARLNQTDADGENLFH